MHVNQICVILFFSFFTTITSKMIQPSLDSDNINVNININGYVYGEVITKEGHYCSENDKKGSCPCPRSGIEVCAGGKTYGTRCMYRCAKKKALCNGSPSFPRAIIGVCKDISNKLPGGMKFISSGEKGQGDSISNEFPGGMKFNSSGEKGRGTCLEPFGIFGDCKMFMIKWSYNRREGKCKKFIYGGCGGNENKFDTRKKCNKVCSVRGKRCTSNSAGQACKCKKIYMPVCSGGKTYGNLCMYKCAKKEAKCNGIHRFPKVTKYDVC